MAAECLTKYLRIGVSSSHIDRIVKHYGSELEEESGLASTAFETSKEKKQTLSSEAKVYAMMDGCMLLTRKKGAWKEMKLGRIFNSDVHYELSSTRNWIKESTYTAHFGGHEVFLDKLEYWLDEYLYLNERLVFINDGAKWIWNWVEDNYPLATQILDFFHAMEYLTDFAKVFFKDKSNRKDWVTQQKQQLLNDNVEQVIELVSGLSCTQKNQQEAQKKLITYYGNNKTRMKYKTYRANGLLIGSGPIESAHRTVIQKRLKQSGQRWTQQGAQYVANLRVANMNNNWEQVVELINKVAA